MLRACAARMNLGIELDRALFLQVPELLHDGAKALCRAIGASKLGRLHEGHRRVRFRVEGEPVVETADDLACRWLR